MSQPESGSVEKKADNNGRDFHVSDARTAEFNNADRVEHQVIEQNVMGSQFNGPIHYHTSQSWTEHDHVVEVEKEKQRIQLEWRKRFLRSLNFRQNESRRTTLKSAHRKTCRWMLERPEFVSWSSLDDLSLDTAILWIKGKPAAGKSTLMKFLHDHTVRTSKTTVIAFFFNARGVNLEKSTEGLYRSLLHQLLTRLPTLELDSTLQSIYEDIDILPRWSADELQNWFEACILECRHKPVTIFVDATDECDRKEVADMISYFDGLVEVARSSDVRLQICFSSRHYPNISSKHGSEIILEDQSEHRRDIQNYLDTELRIGDGERAVKVREKMLTKSSGVFLWIALVVPILNEKYQRGRFFELEEMLDRLPPELQELFEEIVASNREHQAPQSTDLQEFVLCMQLVLYARKPITVHQLYLAIRLRTATNVNSSLDLRGITSRDIAAFVLDCSKGLVEVAKNTNDGYVQFIHESVREYILNREMTTRNWFGSTQTLESRSHREWLICCWQYLKSTGQHAYSMMSVLDGIHSTIEASWRMIAHLHPLLDYAVSEIFNHAECLGVDPETQKHFLRRFNLHFWRALVNCQLNNPYPGQCPLIYILAHRGHASLLRSLVSDPVLAQSCSGLPVHPLYVAAFNTHVDAVKALLSPDTEWKRSNIVTDDDLIQYKNDLDTSANFLVTRIDDGMGPNPYYSPLGFAVSEQNLVLLRCILASSNVDLDSKANPRDCTALYLAAARGNVQMVRMLLEAGANPYTVCGQSGSALSVAAGLGHQEVVNMLLEVPPSTGSTKDYYAIALRQASIGGDQRIVKMVSDAEQNLAIRIK